MSLQDVHAGDTTGSIYHFKLREIYIYEFKYEFKYSSYSSKVMDSNCTSSADSSSFVIEHISREASGDRLSTADCSFIKE